MTQKKKVASLSSSVNIALTVVPTSNEYKTVFCSVIRSRALAAKGGKYNNNGGSSGKLYTHPAGDTEDKKFGTVLYRLYIFCNLT